MELSCFIKNLIDKGIFSVEANFKDIAILLRYEKNADLKIIYYSVHKEVILKKFKRYLNRKTSEPIAIDEFLESLDVKDRKHFLYNLDLLI